MNINNQDHPMIDVDGEQKHINNSTGQRIHPTDEGIRNFHRWFGNDANVDEHGRPKVLYHSSLTDTEAFNSHGKFMGHTGTSGISLTDNPEMASRYLDRFGEFSYDHTPFTKNVIPVYAKIGKVLETNEPLPTRIPMGTPLPPNYVPQHKQMGYDTLVINDSISRKGPVKHSTAKNAIRGKEYVLTNPNDIKSATGNIGKFAKESNKLTESNNRYDPIAIVYLNMVSERRNNNE